MKRFLNKQNIFIFSVFLFSTLLVTFLFRESVEKTVVFLFFISIWFGMFLYTKNIILSSLLYTLLVLPFNLTIQIPLLVEILGTEIPFPSPLVLGVNVNYLVPTISILDFGLLLLLISLILKKGLPFFWKEAKKLKNGLLPFLSFLVIQNIFLNNYFILFSSIRLAMYVIVFFFLVNYLKKKDIGKYFLPISFLFLFNTTIQLVISLLQFKNGSSAGAFFLGESFIVGGMQGSSFVDLGGNVFLRAYGTFPHPNVLGCYLVVSALIGILVVKKIPGIGIPLLILSLFLIPFTFSRMAILLGFLVILFLLYSLIKKVKSNTFSFLPVFLLQRFSNFGGSWDDRRNLLVSSFSILRENWFWGTGFGNYVRFLEEYITRDSRGLLLLQPVHNIFILSLSELGVFGFLSFAYVMVRLVLESIGRLTVFKVLVFSVFLVYGMFDHFMFSLPQGLVVGGVLISLLCFDLESL